jgi:alpha-N-arabinofuranosidase
MLQNRAFQLVSTGTSGLTAWSALNGVSLSVTNSVAGVSSALPNSLQVSVASSTSGSVGFANSGYWGKRAFVD